MAATVAWNRWTGTCPVAEKMDRIWTQWVDLWLNVRNKEVHGEKIMMANVGFSYFPIRKVVLVFRHPSMCGMSLNLHHMKASSEKNASPINIKHRRRNTLRGTCLVEIVALFHKEWYNLSIGATFPFCSINYWQCLCVFHVAPTAYKFLPLFFTEDGPEVNVKNSNRLCVLAIQSIWKGKMENVLIFFFLFWSTLKGNKSGSYHLLLLQLRALYHFTF